MATSTWFGELPDSGAPPWLDELRKAGVDRFDAVGFPTPKSEEWRFTNSPRSRSTQFRPAKPRAATAGASPMPRRDSRFGSRSGQRTGLRQRPLRAAAIEARPAAARRARRQPGRGRSTSESALRSASIWRSYADSTRIPSSRSTPASSATARSSTSAADASSSSRSTCCSSPPAATSRPSSHPADPGRGRKTAAQATLVESYVGAGERRLLHQRRHRNRRRPRLPASTIASCSRNRCRPTTSPPCRCNWAATAHFVSHSASIGVRITRNDLNVVMAGEHADATLNGLVLSSGEQHVDNHTLLDHAAPALPEPRAVQGHP